MHRYSYARELATFVLSLAFLACGAQSAAAPGGNGGGNGGGGGGGGNGGGTISGAKLAANAGVGRMTLAWSGNGARSYNLYVSSSPECDIANYTLCPDGRMFVDVSSPFTVDELENGQVYYAQVEGIHKKGESVSNRAGARPTTLEFNHSVLAMATATDGTTYLGGDFTRVGLMSGHGVILDALSGQPSVPAFPIFGRSRISAAAADGAGGWYLAGGLGNQGDVTRRSLVHVRSDGSIDSNWNPMPAGGEVQSIAVMNGVVYLGGFFDTINGQQRRYLAAVDAATGALLAWNPTANLGVVTLAAANGRIYAGGTFTSIGGFARNRLAAIDTSGNVLPWDPDADATVLTLAISGSTVFAGGHFGEVSGLRRNRIAAIDATTGVPKAWDASLDCVPCEVRAIAVSGSTVYLGGRFPRIGGVARNSLAAVDVASGGVRAWNPGADATVRSLAVINSQSTGTTIYVGGDFQTIGGKPRGYLAAVNAQGAVLTWDPAPTDSVDFLWAAGSQVIAGGLFSGLGAVPRHRLAAVGANGELATWNPDVNGPVGAMALAGETIYIGGAFTTIGGQPRQNIAKLYTNGDIDAWSPNINKTVRALALSEAGTLYVGGEFSQVLSSPRTFLASFAPNGLLRSWAPTVDRLVYAIAVGPTSSAGESVYVGGDFWNVNGKSRRLIAQIDGQAQVTAWDPWGNQAVNDRDEVNVLLYADGMIYAGGGFSKIGLNFAEITEAGQPQFRLGATGRVSAMSLSGRTLYLGGEFTSMLNASGVQPRTRLAAYDTVSRSLTEWSPEIGHGGVYALSSTSGVVHIGGSFTQVNGQVVSGFATLER